MIVEKAVKMAELMNVPVLGIVENMSYFECPDCGKRHSVFGESKIDEIAASHGIKTVAKLPMNTNVAAACDNGAAEELDAAELTEMAENLENLIK